MKSKEVEYNGQKVTIYEGEAAIVNEWGGLRTIPVSYLKDPQQVARIRSIEGKLEAAVPNDGLEQLSVSELREQLLNLQIAMPMSASKESLVRAVRDEVARRTPSRTTREDRERKSTTAEWHEMKKQAKMLAEQNGVDMPKSLDKKTLIKFIEKYKD